MSKTLADIAQDAYINCHPMQDGWKAAAEAVVKEVTSKAAINEQQFYSPVSPTTDKEQAVIEAAKRWKAGYPIGKPVRPMHWSPADALLWEAVRALDSEEE